MSTINRRIKQIVTKKGLVPMDRLEEVSIRAESEGTSLATALAGEGLVEPAVMLGVMSQEIGFPPIDLARVSPDPDAPAYFAQEMAEKYNVYPVSKVGMCLTLAMPDPFDIVKIDQLRLETRMEIRPVIASEEGVKDAQKRLYDSGNDMADLLDQMGDDDVEHTEAPVEEENTLELDASEGSPAVKLVNMIIYQGVRDRASDIHIEPFERTIRVRFRMDGVLREMLSPPKNLQSAMISRIKIMCGLDIAERRNPQDGKFQVKVEGRPVDFRVSTLPMVHGEKVVLRILDGGNLALSLESLGFEPKALEDYRHAIKQPYGMILITGPTGSGKSTTLYSALKEIYSPEINFVTVEDPVEYQLDGINQVPVNPKQGLTFAAALRSILRQDPDVVMIGEIRDKETAEIAVKAALTGHLVLSTLHTNDAPSTVTRLVDMGLDPFLVSSSVILICAQRLMRKLCENCKVLLVDPPAQRLLDVGFLEDEIEGVEIYEAGPGCSRCTAGFKGRFAILETLPFTEQLRRDVIEGKSALTIKDTALSENMISLRRTGVLNVLRGRTSIDEVLRVTLAD